MTDVEPRRAASRGGDWLEEVTVEAPGVDEVGVEPWPLLYRLRARRRRGAPVPTTGPANRWTVLVIVLAGLFCTSITVTILAVSLVDIANDLGTTTSIVSWAITGPMLAFGIMGPAAGKLGDVHGHKKVFLAGLLGAAVFALLTALSWSALTMILFRTLSAGFGSATGPSAMAMINRLFDADERVQALGYWSFVSAGSPVLGVVLGGPLVEAVGWRVIFFVQAPLLLGGFVLALVKLPETDRGLRARFDAGGAVLLGLGVTAFLLAINRGSAWGWAHPIVVSCLVVAPLLLAGFVAVERRVEEPLLPLEWLRRRNVVAPIGSQALANFAYMGGFVLTPVLLEDGLGYTTAAVGLLIISRPLAFSLTAPLAGKLTLRVGERFAGVAGGLVLAASMVVLATLGASSMTITIVAALALSGIGLGLSSPALTATVANAVDDLDLGTAGALQQLMVQIGAVVGVQVMQSVQQGTLGHGIVPSYHLAYLVGCVFALASAAVALSVRPSLRVERLVPEPA